MKFIKFGIKNFRGFGKSLSEIKVADFTCLIGKNDAGKSTVFDAMDIFFNGNSSIDDEDFHIDVEGDKVTRAEEIELVGTFGVKGLKVKIESVPTSLKEEALVDEEERLEIVQRIKSSKKTGIKTYIVAYLPNVDEIKNIHTLKNADLKKMYKRLLEEGKVEEVNQTTNTLMRKEIIKYYKGEKNTAVKVEVPIDKEGGKDLWSSISKSLPVFQLFKTDRDNTDRDAEIQSPMKAIIKSTLQDELENELENITKKIKDKTMEQANATLEKLEDMDPNLAKSLVPNFTDPTWTNVFKFSLETDNIPLNKRGSGTRRLILLSFFRAEAEKAQNNSDSKSIIYAFEEPETAQHIDHQKSIMEAFKEISCKKNQQVLITTHSSELAGVTNLSDIREITKNEKLSEINNSVNLLKIHDELGVFPSAKDLPKKIRMIIFVEGPNDLKFLEILLRQYWPKVEQEDIAIVPFGGGAFPQWLNLKVLGSITRKYYIFDNDTAGKGYERELRKSDLESKAHLWHLGTIEYYFPYEIYCTEVENYNKSNECNKEASKEPLKTISKEEYHKADYNKQIRPVKGSLWGKLEKIDECTLINYWSSDSEIDKEFKSIAEELEACYIGNSGNS